MKILIGVDDSPHSKAAVDFVNKMTWPRGSQAIVLSAVQPLAPIYADLYVPAPPSAEAMDDTMEWHRRMAADAERALQGGQLTTESRVIEGDPRIALVDTAAKEHMDLVVVGSHGRSGLAKLLMGSVASHVVTHAPCNVLVVKMESR